MNDNHSLDEIVQNHSLLRRVHENSRRQAEKLGLTTTQLGECWDKYIEVGPEKYKRWARKNGYPQSLTE